jgi:hypothetical protein
MFHNLTPVLFNREKKTENKNRAFSTTLSIRFVSDVLLFTLLFSSETAYINICIVNICYLSQHLMNSSFIRLTYFIFTEI